MVLLLTDEFVRLVNGGSQGCGQEVATARVDEATDTVSGLKKQIDQLQRDAKSHEAVKVEQKTEFEKQITHLQNQIERMKEENNRLENCEKQNEAQCEKQMLEEENSRLVKSERQKEAQFEKRIMDLRNQVDELKQKNNQLELHEKEASELAIKVEMLENMVDEYKEANGKLADELAEERKRAEQATAASKLTTGGRKSKKEAIEAHAEARKILESSLNRIAWVRSRLELLAKEAAEADVNSK